MCYLTGRHGQPDVPSTVKATAAQAHAEAGADIVGPAFMVLGTVGADMILLEPAQFTADVLTTLRGVTRAPLFPFSVSGEYTALTRVDSETRRRDVRLLVELFTMLKRAGASASVTYAALDIARQLN